MCGRIIEEHGYHMPLPFFLTRFIVWFCRKLDVHGKVPKSMIESDPYYTTVVFSNLGSIRLKSGYHHLTNWGSNSLFCIVGKRSGALL